jgi:hypothetical protein
MESVLFQEWAPSLHETLCGEFFRVQLLSFTVSIREYAEFIRQAHESVAVLALCISGRDFCARAGPALWFYHERTR